MLKDSSLLKIHFGISGDFFTYFLLQYFQRTLFYYSSVFADCKDRNFILICKNFFSLFFLHFRFEKISHSTLFKEQLLVKADAKIGTFIFDLQMFLCFFRK